ncbi:DUF2156 domain-containing protein [Mycoplasma sp. P36-A1]|uniref:DUF2156 domain-containing protein n=1 Tax=Mycoplasma sp. P36-A1 TaxID=3252900 RepID=UPI003C2CEEC8
MFCKYSLELKEEIEKHVSRLNYKDHNLSFTNMFLWKDKFKLKVYLSDEFIIVFSNFNNHLFSLNPICVLENVDQAIEFLIKYFEKEKLPFTIHNCVRKVKEQIESVYGDYFNYELDRDSFDYLYSIEKILTYSGKKLQKKRNHVNNFKKQYEGRYTFKEIDGNKDVAQDCIDFTLWWASQKVVHDEYMQPEVDGTIDVLNNFEKLSCEGLACYIDGKIAAFGIGTQLNDKTAVLNVEKADGDIIGLYPFMRQNLVKTFFDDLTYLNTEDDVGDVGLRKSKLSYQPEYLVDKFTITRADEKW